jgi:uncharacterized SAM-binding protein YcdF (DUF218 family)
MIVFLILAVAWGIGLARFSAKVQNQNIVWTNATDAVVVLTGGPGRLQAGADVLIAGMARQLYITGVDPAVRDIRELNLNWPNSFDPSCCVALGQRATDTYGNAVEAAMWVQAQKFSSMRLVTSAYHMPRALLEFKRLLPGVRIVPHPVGINTGAGLDRWLIWSEYHKYLVVKLGHHYLGQYL